MSGYRRLPGSRRGVIRRASAWAGADHILLVEGSRTSEKYRRIYFRDIQALTIEKRNRFVVGVPWLLLVPGLLAAGAMTPAPWRASGTTWLIAGLLLLAAIGYLSFAGMYYGCRLFIATAVGNVQVGSVFRTWQARRFHQSITPVIQAAQGDPQ